MRSFCLFLTLISLAHCLQKSCYKECYLQTCNFDCGGCPNDVTIGLTVQAYMLQIQNVTNNTVILQIVKAVTATSQKATEMYSDNYHLSCELNCNPLQKDGLCAVYCQDCNPQGLCTGILTQMQQILNQSNLLPLVEHLANTTAVFCEPYANTGEQHGMNWLGFILLISFLGTV